MNIESQLVKDLIATHIAGKSDRFCVLPKDRKSRDFRKTSVIYVHEWNTFVGNQSNSSKGSPSPVNNEDCQYIIINAKKGEEHLIAELEDVRKIKGIFYTDDSLCIFEKGLAAILDGEIWIPRRVLLVWMAHKGRNHSQRHHDTLSSREISVLKLIVAGLSNKEISQELYISANTVKAHLYNIYKKIDVSNRLQAAIWASNNISSHHVN